MVFEGIEKRQVFQGIAALLRCCQIVSRHTYNSNGKMNLFFPNFPWFARCKRGVNCMRDGQKCLILQGKSAFVRGLPWQTKSILVKCVQPPEKPYSPQGTPSVCPVLPRFAGQKKLLIFCDSVTEKAKYGKMRQVNAVNGSQMVVKLRGSYYCRDGR